MGGSRPLAVNGTTIAASQAFAPTGGGWATWSLSSAAANLISGNKYVNTIGS